MARRSCPCIYCSRPADTSDHVPPRLLLRKPFPVPMMTVPSCKECNHGASLDEEYFRVILAQVGVTSHLSDMVAPGGVVDRALARSDRLSQRIADAATVGPGGQPMIAPEHFRVNRILAKIAHGLFVVRYKRNPGSHCFRPLGLFPFGIEDLRPPYVLMAAFTERFLPKRWTTIQRDVFAYTFVRHPADGRKQLCLLGFYGEAWGAVESPHWLAGEDLHSSFQTSLL